MQDIPDYDALPLIPEFGYPHSWDLFGRDDDRGTLNFPQPTSVLEGAALVRTGETIPLGLPLAEPAPPFYGREPMQHSIFHLARTTSTIASTFLSTGVESLRRPAPRPHR